MTDSAGNTQTGAYTLTVDPGVSIKPSGGALPTAYANSAYSTTLAASGGSGTGAIPQNLNFTKPKSENCVFPV